MTTVTGVLKSFPLTTTFTPPPTCTDSFAIDGPLTSPSGSKGPNLQAVFPQSSACFAPGWTSGNVFGKGGNSWSGDPVCPSGQSVAQTYSSGSWTTAICCSSGWGNVFTNGNAYDETTYTFFMCQGSWSTPATTTVFGTVQSGGIIAGDTATLTGPGNMESTAEYIFLYTTLTPTSTSTSSTSSTSPTSSTTSTPTPSASATPLPTPGSTGLSAGAKAGIAIGAVVLLLMAGLAFFCFRRRRKTAAAENAYAYSSSHDDKTDLSTQSRMLAELSPGTVRHVGELPGAGWYKGPTAQSYGQPVELEGH